MRRIKHAEGMGERRNAYRNVIGKPECKRLFRGPRCRWEGNIIKEVNGRELDIY
jgi:hypothetical protein